VTLTPNDRPTNAPPASSVPAENKSLLNQITPEPWTLNGLVPVGSREFWRIDSLRADGPTGVAFLMNPLALVKGRNDADLIRLAPRLARSLKAAQELIEFWRETAKSITETCDSEAWEVILDKYGDRASAAAEIRNLLSELGEGGLQ
jgi:hypothetical protein